MLSLNHKAAASIALVNSNSRSNNCLVVINAEIHPHPKELLIYIVDEDSESTIITLRMTLFDYASDATWIRVRESGGPRR